jgi:hypothetical protein
LYSHDLSNENCRRIDALLSAAFDAHLQQARRITRADENDRPNNICACGLRYGRIEIGGGDSY